MNRLTALPYRSLIISPRRHLALSALSMVLLSFVPAWAAEESLSENQEMDQQLEQQKEQGAEKGAEQQQPYLFSTEVRLLSDAARVVGTVRAKRSTSMSARVSGVILDLPVSLGQEVAVGELIAALGADELDARLARARAENALAQAELARIEKLNLSGTASPSTLDSQRAGAAAATAALQEAETLHGYLTLHAPYAGVITERAMETGDLAQPGRVIVSLADPSALRLEVAVPEQSASVLKLGATVSVIINNQRLSATVAEIAATADAATRTLLVKIDLPTLEHLRIGQFGQLLLPGQPRAAIVIPQAALIRRGQLEQVAVVEGGIASIRLVRTGRAYEEQVEIVSGLNPAENVLVYPDYNVADGDKVTAGNQP